MAGTFTRLLYHVVFSTKHRANLIAPELQARLYDRLGGIVRGFAWQEGYAAFTVSPSQFETVRRYVQNQAAHHQQRGFVEELKALLDAHRIEYDQRYLQD